MKAQVLLHQPEAEVFTPEGCYILELSNNAEDDAVSIARARTRVSQWAFPVVSVKADGTTIRSTSPIAR